MSDKFIKYNTIPEEEYKYIKLTKNKLTAIDLTKELLPLDDSLLNFTSDSEED